MLSNLVRSYVKKLKTSRCLHKKSFSYSTINHYSIRIIKNKRNGIYRQRHLLNNSTFITSIYTQKRLCTNKPSAKNIIDHNEERSKSHKSEILDNEYPNLDEIKHPNLSVATTDFDSFYIDTSRPKFEDYVLPHPIWTEEELNSIKITHKKPSCTADKMAYFTVQLMRLSWDLSTGYTIGRRLGLFKFTHRMWLLRLVFLETVAGVPGMMFGMVRHLNSLRRLERDRGWILTLLSEAENERIHLLTAMYLYKPSKLLRAAIIFAQGMMSTFLFSAYLISPRYCHSLVGYLEEQAVATYGGLLDDIENGKYPEFQEKASNLAKAYWKLHSDATWYDVFRNIRADESKHRDVNHQLSDLSDDPKAVNPFRRGM